MAASGSLPRTALNSLFNSPNRFESEVGTDAGLDEDGEEDLLFGGTFGAAGSSIGSNASRFIGTGGLLEHSSSRLHHGGGGSAHHNMIGSPSQSQNGANMLVNVEPYNARLARSLFSDVTQTSVLRHHSTNGAIDANASHDDASLTNRDGEPDVSYQDRLAVAKSMSSALRRSPVPTASGVSPLLQRRQSSMMMLDGGDHPEEEEEGPAGAGAGAEGLLRRISSQAAASRSPSRSLGATTMRIGQNTPQSQRGHCGFGGGSLSRNENRFDGSRTSVADYSLAGRGQSLFMDDDDDDDNNNEEEGGQNAGVAQSSFRVLSGSATATASHLGGGGNDAARFDQSPAVVFEQNKAKNFMSRGFRHISSTPDRILDAARLVDEFYYNVLDCSCHNVVAVALEAALYLWDWSTENISTLPPENSFISGVKWAPDGIRLASSNEEGDVVVWDTETSKDDAVFTVHKERVCALAWNATGNILASGSKDASIVLNDTRSRTPALTLPKGVGHTKEVCGLQWSLRDLYLASGGDDNKLLVWDSRRLDTPLHTLTQHSSAVKALSWHPIQPHLLVSGGGIEDKMLRFWSADTGECVRQAHTSSQVCGVAWHHSGTELVSCHGFPHHQITLWKYPSLNRVVDLCGHRSRVLHLCLSAGGETVISAASDETVRFWSCFPPGPEAQQNGDEDEEG